MNPRAPRITVLGSINMDLVVRCDVLPRPGETRLAETSREICGGKGANQAVAAARAGGDVSLIGRVGDDAFSSRLVANLQREGINCESILATEDCASGLAVVAVERSGQNSILVVPNANARLSVADVQAAQAVIEASDVLLVQLEVPLSTVLAALEIARAAKVRIILDPAPAPAACPAPLLDVDLICPNETEAAAIVGIGGDRVDQVELTARELHRRGARNVALTLGPRGTFLLNEEKSEIIASFPVTAVDTTAAGDAFAGALAVFWAEEADLATAVRLANAAGALAATREGAQPGMATRDEIQQLGRIPS